MFRLDQKFIPAVMTVFICLAAPLAYGETLRDPTRPLNQASAPSTVRSVQQPLRLQSVLVSDSRRIAYINGQQLRERDVIKGSGNVQLVRIDARGVLVQQGDKQWRLELDSVAVRR